MTPTGPADSVEDAQPDPATDQFPGLDEPWEPRQKYAVDEVEPDIMAADMMAKEISKVVARLRGRCKVSGCECVKYTPLTDKQKPINSLIAKILPERPSR